MGNLGRIWQHKLTGEFLGKKPNDDYVTTKLAYDYDTRVVYYKFSEVIIVKPRNFEKQEEMDTNIGFMSPYISKNGKYCCFSNNKIVEIP